MVVGGRLAVGRVGVGLGVEPSGRGSESCAAEDVVKVVAVAGDGHDGAAAGVGVEVGQPGSAGGAPVEPAEQFDRAPPRIGPGCGGGAAAQGGALEGGLGGVAENGGWATG